MQKIIQIENATVYRGRTKVFDGLSLEIARGCNTAILGPNGAGKTTLLQILSRELYPVQGDDSYVRIFGRERWNVWELRSRFGIVSFDLQHRYLSKARGIDVILSGYYSSVGTWPHQEFTSNDRRRAQRIMQRLEIVDLQDKAFSEMSAGEQRRFLLGRALVHDPEALVLDEPTSGLDLKACFQYLNIVRRLMQDGKTLVLVTHRIHEIPPEVSRVVLLKAGTVIADGEKREILTSETLSWLFETSVELVHANGFYQTIPGDDYI